MSGDKRLRMTKIASHDTLNKPVLGSSHKVGMSELDLHSVLPVQDDISKVTYDRIWPQNGSLVDTNPEVVFIAPPSPHFSDLSDSYFRMELKLVKQPDPAKKDDTSKIVPEDLANVSNFTAMSLWKDITLFIAGRPINSCFGNALFEAYFKLLTQCSEEALRKWEISGYYPEKVSELLLPNDAKVDPATKARYDRFGKGNKQVLYMPILTNLCSQMRYIPSLCEIKIVLTKGTREWQVTQPTANKAKFHIELTDIQLMLKRPILYPSRLKQLESRLSSGSPANYYINNSYIRSFQIDQNTTSIRLPDLLLCSYLPSYCIIGLIQTSDYKGDVHSTNFNFKLFNLKELYLQSVSKKLFLYNAYIDATC